MIQNNWFLHLDHSDHRELLFITSRAKTKAQKGEREIAEGLTTYATAEFKKAGEYELYVAKNDNPGPFKQTHVRVFSFLVRRVDVSLLTFIFTTVTRFEKQGWHFQDSVYLSFGLQVWMNGLSLSAPFPGPCQVVAIRQAP
jgi:hypothetical protein